MKRRKMDLVKAVEDADFVFEAVPEVLKIKQEVFNKLGSQAPARAILASNTSTISISKIGEYSGRPERVVGMHFFIPLFGNRLIELIRGKETSDEVLDICAAIGEKFPCPYYKNKMMLHFLYLPYPKIILQLCYLYLNENLFLVYQTGILYIKYFRF